MRFLITLIAVVCTATGGIAGNYGPVHLTREIRSAHSSTVPVAEVNSSEGGFEKAPAAKRTLKVTLDFDPEEYTVDFVMCYGEGCPTVSAKWYQITGNVVELSVKEGNYDVLAHFYAYDPSPEFMNRDNYKPRIFVIRENVEVGEQGAEVMLNPGESNRLVTFEPVNADGESWRVGVLKFLDQEPWYEFDESKANCWDVSVLTGIQHPRFGWITSLPSNWGHELADGRRGRDGNDFYINDVSQDYKFIQYWDARTDEENIWQGALMTFNSGQHNVAKGLRGYQTYMPQVCNSPKYEELGKKADIPFFVTALTFLRNTILSTHDFFFEEGNAPAIHFMDLGRLERAKGIANGIEAGAYDYYDRANDVALAVKSPSIVSSNDGIMTISGAGTYFNMAVDNIDVPFGEAVGVFVGEQMGELTNLHQADSPRYIWFYPKYRGLLDEQRDADVVFPTARIWLNDEPVFNGGIGRELDDFSESHSEEGNKPGVLKVEFSNDNYFVDGLHGSNVTTMTINETNFIDDKFYFDIEVPIIGTISVRDAEGHANYRFASDDAGEVLFSAYDIGNDRKLKPIDVKAEISPYHLDEWRDLKIETVVEMNAETSVPAVYRVPVDCGLIAGESDSKWWDLKLTVCDEYGNIQQQVLSPFFKVGGETPPTPPDGALQDAGIEDVAMDVAYYNLQGVRIDNPVKGSVVVCRCGSRVWKAVIR